MFNCTLQYANEIESDPMKVKVLMEKSCSPHTKMALIWIKQKS